MFFWYPPLRIQPIQLLRGDPSVTSMRMGRSMMKLESINPKNPQGPSNGRVNEPV